MRSFILVSTLAFSTVLSATTHALPEATPRPTAFLKRDSDDDARRVSEALASATSAIAAHPSDASSIVSELRDEYGTILDRATGCDSSRWARITGAIDDLDEDFGDGLRGILDGIFDGDDDDDECEDDNDDDDDDDGDDGDDDDNDDDDGLLAQVVDNGVTRTTGVTFFGAMGAVLLAGAALL